MKNMPRTSKGRAILFGSAVLIYASVGTGLVYAGWLLIGYLCLAAAVVSLGTLCMVPFFSPELEAEQTSHSK
jgi:hypothetical protein